MEKLENRKNQQIIQYHHSLKCRQAWKIDRHAIEAVQEDVIVLNRGLSNLDLEIIINIQKIIRKPNRKNPIFLIFTLIIKNDKSRLY